MLQVKNLSLSFGKQTVFDQIAFKINSDQRIGLIGRNGAGKTTLFKIIAGTAGFDSGSVDVQRGNKIAYMAQDVVLLSEQSILHEALSVFGDLVINLETVEALEQLLSDPTVSHDAELINKYSAAQHYLLEHDSNEKLVQTKRILLGLGFKQDDLAKPVNQLSVGWKMRLVLAKLLLENADFYLFDEPTNHLDLVAKDWFFEFLKNSNFGFLLICHDAYFLNGLCTEIFDLANGTINEYSGNYDAYQQQKAETDRLTEKKYVEQQKTLTKQRQTIERFRYSASKAKMAQSMLKALDKVELVKFEQKSKRVSFSFPEVERAGKVVLTCKNLRKSFDEKTIFEQVSFELERGKKAAIVAQNGVGKTTLLNLITGKYPHNSGEIVFGHKVKNAVFEQDQNRSLDQTKTILQEVEDACITSEQRMRVRASLGAFLFSGDDVYKKISVLSGGEKNRVAMVKVLLQDANFLMLDEPTNHLDIQSKEVLLNVLQSYTGTILFVSHDRAFLNSLATDILELTPKGIHHYFGNYDSFLHQKDQAQNKLETKAEQKRASAEPAQPKKTALSYEATKKLRNLESKIAKLENEKLRLKNDLGLQKYGSIEHTNNLDELKKISAELEKAYQNYMALEKG